MKELKIGRSADNDICITDASVSRRHATLIISGVNYSIRDEGSSNGTFVNGRRINGTVAIQSSDIIKVGESLVPWRNYLNVAEKAGERKHSQTVQDMAETQKVEWNAPSPKKKSVLPMLFTVGIVVVIVGAAFLFFYGDKSDAGKMKGRWDNDSAGTNEISRLTLEQEDKSKTCVWLTDGHEVKGKWSLDEKAKVLTLDATDPDSVGVQKFDYKMDEEDVMTISTDSSDYTFRKKK